MQAGVRARPEERSRRLAGDEVVGPADVVMDRGLTLPADPATVWPWLVQLGNGRAGWYLPRRLERLLPPRGRAARHVDDRWQHLDVGDVVPDYGRDATFEVVRLEAPFVLVYRSHRGRLDLTWAIVLTPEGPAATRVHLRLRLAGIRRRWLASTFGELLDALTVAGMAAGLRERLQERR